MDAVKFLQERNRMYESGAATPSIGLEDDYDPVSAVEVVEKWFAAHPRKTRQSVFLEQYPQADIDNTGLLILCPKRISADIRVTADCMRQRCSDCRRKFWTKVVE